MPTYEYACQDCGEHLEVVQSFKDDALTTCGACTGRLRKVFSAAGIIFKGSGYYVTDSRKAAAAKAEAAKGKAGAGKSDGGQTGPDKSESAKSDSGQTGADKSDSPKSDSAKTDSAKSDRPKPDSAPKAESA